jgi:hypothetical protein
MTTVKQTCSYIGAAPLWRPVGGTEWRSVESTDSYPSDATEWGGTACTDDATVACVDRAGHAIGACDNHLEELCRHAAEMSPRSTWSMQPIAPLPASPPAEPAAEAETDLLFDGDDLSEDMDRTEVLLLLGALALGLLCMLLLAGPR